MIWKQNTSIVKKLEKLPHKFHSNISKPITDFQQGQRRWVYGCYDELGLRGYTDASFETDLDDSQSQSGTVFMLNRFGRVPNKTRWPKSEYEYIVSSELQRKPSRSESSWWVLV